MTFWRFAQYVVIEKDCWRWIGTKASSNHTYGQFSDETGKRIQAHRFSYEFFVGPIPSGLQIDHLCRVKTCVNPRHLEPVTAKENSNRGRIARLHGVKTLEKRIKTDLRGPMDQQIRKGLRLPKSLIARIEKAAKGECSTFSQFIRTAVVKELNERKKLAT